MGPAHLIVGAWGSCRIFGSWKQKVSVIAGLAASWAAPALFVGVAFSFDAAHAFDAAHGIAMMPKLEHHRARNTTHRPPGRRGTSSAGVAGARGAPSSELAPSAPAT